MTAAPIGAARGPRFAVVRYQVEHGTAIAGAMGSGGIGAQGRVTGAKPTHLGEDWRTERDSNSRYP